MEKQGSKRVGKKGGVPQIADLVEPVPHEVVPMALRTSTAGLELFKEEFRAAQRLRSTEGIFIPEVVRTTHPPDLAPHGVSSNPAPSYVLASHLKRPLSRKAMGPGHLSQPNPQPGPQHRGRGFDYAEAFLNGPNTDYLLSRQIKPDVLASMPTAASPVPASPVSPSKNRPTSALNASMASRINSAARPMTANMRSPPVAGAAGAALAGTAAQTTKAFLATNVLALSPTSTPPGSPGHHTTTTTSSKASHATSKASTPMSKAASWSASGCGGALAGPDPRGSGGSPQPPRPISPSRLSGMFPAILEEGSAAFIMNVDEGEGMLGEPGSRPMSGLPPRGAVAAGRGAAAARLMVGSRMSPAPGGGPDPSFSPSGTRPPFPTDAYDALREQGLAMTMPTETVQGVVNHMRAASASLRRYNLPPATSAISSVATTFARKPKAPHKQDPRQATPSERIANNYSPAARGLSPRTVEAFMPGGIKPGAAGPLPVPRWQGVDDEVVEAGVPEADGVITAAKQHMSFMPLELFDNLEYEMYTPQEWVALGADTQGTPAETVLYQLPSDTYTWAPCWVVGWDEDSRQFEVLFAAADPAAAPITRQDSKGGFVTVGKRPLAGGLKSKMVKRLNLRFQDEHPALFERRVAGAKVAREEAEAQLRAMFYLDALDHEVEEVMATYDFHAALGSAAMQVRGLSGPVLEAVGRVLLEDVADYYERAIKKAILAYRRLDPMEETRLRVLRIPAMPTPTALPYSGLLPVTAPQPITAQDGTCTPQFGARLHAYGDLLKWGSTHLFMAQPVLLDALAHVESIAQAIASQPLWCLGEETPEFKLQAGSDGFATHEAGKPPFPLARFEALQHSHLRQALSFVKMKLVQALNVTEDEELVRLMNNGELYDEDTPRSDAHLSLLRFVRLRMADGVHEVLLKSATLYADCLESYQLAPPTPLDGGRKYGGVREVFAAGAFLRVAVEERRLVEARLREEAARKLEAAKAARLLQSNPSVASLAAVEEEPAAAADAGVATEGAVPPAAPAPPDATAHQPEEGLLIMVVPSASEIADVAAGMLGDMIDDTSTVEDCYTSDQREPELLCDFTAWRDDATLALSKKRVAATVAAGIERAHEVATLFEEAAAALNVDVDALLSELSPMETALSVYTSHISRFRAAAQAAVNATPNEVWTGLLVVDTTPLKASLSERAESLVEALLSQLLDKSTQAYNHVCVRCESISSEVNVVAQDTKGVLDLRNKLAAAEAELDVLRAMITASRERDAFRVAYRHVGSLDETFAMVSLRAQCWPRDMQDVFSRAWRKVDLEHFHFQDALKLKRETLKADVAEVTQAVATYKEITDPAELAENAHHGQALEAQLAALAERSALINEEEGLFGWDKTEWPQVGELQKDLEPYAGLWHVVSEFALQSEDWMYGNMQSLNPEQIDELVSEWYKRMQRLSKSMPLAEHRRLADATREKLEAYKEYIPVINAICNPGMRGRHWDQVSKVVGAKVWPGEELQLQRLLKLNIVTHLQALQDVSDAASREHSLERQLDKMQGEWAGVALELGAWKDTGGFILKGTSVEEAQLLLDDHSIKSQAMQSSPAAAAFIDRIDAWVKKLGSMQDIFDAWLMAQSKWMYLGPVYGSEEIAKQMPKERKEFTAADAKWRSIMQGVQRQPEILQVTETEHLLEDLTKCNNSFNVIEKSLNAYLDSKKLLFPRFFFLSNDELIEILSEAKDPLNVQPFVKKIFEAVNTFEFNSNTDITAMISIEGERIPFDVPVETGGEFNGVERWLLKTEEMMRQSLTTITKNALEAYPTRPRDQWILEWPGQVVIAVGQTYWTRATTKAILEGGTFGLTQLEEQNTKELLEEVKLVRGDLTSLQRSTIGALVVIDVHGRDVVAEMVVDKVATVDDFSWQSRLRYYWEKNTLLVRMLNAECVYGYEYLGNSTRLVITPLTDRCYRTLLGAHHLNLGGAPAGPAGTGKTETTKDLAKAVAIQCVVFNCSDGLDYIAMGKFFKGLAASGAWACFDEFNRIELEVLSVVAQQVLTIQRAKAAQKKRFTFEGADLPLVLTCNVFITMNPGYAGRSELPDNLKALFRDVAMMVPDYAMIAEIMLYSYGYLDARSLAGKLVQTYRLCSEQLSRQDHYDYGMRAVMAVLRAAGNLKRKLPDEAEDVLMLRAITDVNLPKFLDEDVPLFRGILSDLFPGIALPEMDYVHITEALIANSHKLGLQPLPAFLEKAIQLYEMIVVRHGLMLVGLSFGMKTSAIRVLAGALGDMCTAGQGEYKVKFVSLNPKSVTLGQLYGQDDPVSKEWTDGVLAVAFRNAARDTSNDRKWLVLDGPVDAIWIENMNTVLDDNKKLCLNSGEIIAMQGLMNLIFEVADLAVASPATVSRCGMVYMQPSLLGWRPVVASWMGALPEKTVTTKYRESMNLIMEALVPPLLRLVTKDCKQPVAMQEINLVQSMVRLYQALLQPLITPPQPLPPGTPPPAEKPVVIGDGQAAVEACLLFAIVWGVGGTVDAAGRAAINTHLRNFIKGEYGPYTAWVPEGVQKLPAFKKPLPAEGSVYDWVYDVASGGWKEWMETVPEQKISPEAEYSQIIVSTVDVVRYTFLVSTLVAAHQPMLMVGPTGTGKSVYIQRHLASGLDRKTWVATVFNFSAQTSANVTQDIIDGKLDKRRKGVFGPPVGKHAVVFVDDLNMPQVEKYGAQPPIELLRQYMDHGGWFDRTDNSFRKLVDVQFIAAMGPPGGGRNPVTNRYARHFNVLHVNEFDDASKAQIFSALVSWWFARCKFGDEFNALRNGLVMASLDVYTTVIKELLPTPAKTHYLFNLRDLSKVFQGMSSAGVDVMSDPNKMIRLWAHEVLRVFHDRLVDDQDRQWISTLVMDKIEEHFKRKPKQVLSTLAAADGSVGPAELRTLMWADFMIPGAEPQKYDEISSLNKMSEVVAEYLKEYNAASKKPLNLVLFQFALEHVARVARVIKQPGGHALLVGVGGSGRQSLTQLAAFMEDYNVFSVEISATYTTQGPNNNWHDDLKKAIRYAGEKRKPAVFLFSDSQIVNETMVEDISNLLNTGEVPNLFDTGEMLAIGESVRNRAKAAHMDGSRADLFAFFVMEVRRFLHVVLCFSPVGGAFRERLRKFPSLVTCTTIDWFTVWPDDALRSVALQAVQDLSLGADLGGRLAEQCMRFHTATRELSERFRKDYRRHFYVTPTSYLQLLDCFKGLLTRKREEVATAQRRYEVGLEKLASTEGQVQGMQSELEALQPQLKASSVETEQLMGVITLQTAEADKVKSVVQADEAVALEEAAKVKAIKDECEADLAEALPAYNAALKALDTLTKNDISEVKGMKSPPAPVRLVMEAVCILKGLKPTKVKDKDSGKFVNDFWETSKKMLSDMGFLDSLRTYDKDNIPPEFIEALKPLLGQPDFQPEKIKKVSQAAFGLCSWVRAMDTYNRVAKVVGPKKLKLAEAMTQLAGVQQALAAKQAQLREVEAQLAELGESLFAARTKKEGLQADVAMCEEKLDRAQKLIGGLGGEKVRWTSAATDLAALYERLVGDMLLASGVIAYLGVFPGDLRQSTLAGWVKEMGVHEIPCTPTFSFIGALGDAVRMRQWAIWGLPRDDVSAANGIIVHNSKRWPLCIDPQGQANKWIRSMEAQRKLVVLKPSTDPTYLRSLQAALPMGRPVLLEGLGESLDASLEPVLLRLTFKQAGVLCVKLGEGVVEWSPDFSLYMTTKLRNPHYPPEVCTRVCLLNFCITPVGLEDQLLGVVVAKERPDLEEDKARLIVQGAENVRKLKEIEDQILKVLSASQGNILDDGEAVEILQASKKLSDEIAAKQKDAERTEVAIDRARTGYAPIAAHASTLFFCVAELANIDPMYQYSLTYFLSLFVRSIEDSPHAPSVPKRLEVLRDHFTFFLYTNVCRSLFEKDKLLFAFCLATAVAQAEGKVERPQLRFLLTGALSMDNPHPNPASDWISDQAWSHLCELNGLAPPFAGLRSSLTSATPAWRAFYDHPTPHSQPLPDGYGAELDTFQKLLVIRCILPDKLVPAIQAYVSSTLGARYVEPQAFRLDTVFADSAAAVPLIFVLSFGSDPMADLLRFADERHKQVETVSLGQGQGPIAEKWIDQAVKEGFWVVLQNCHLAKSFLPRLELICEKTLGGEGAAGAVHPEFRLWLTSYPSPDFPQSILENGLKITNEPPKGLKAGLQRIYKSDPLTDPSFFDGCGAEGAFKNLLLSLAFFHCVAAGRRLYGPVGWNIPYTFNENDLRISLRQLRMFLSESAATNSPPPMAMLSYTAGECNYGGKVTDSKDRRTLMVLLSRFYNDDVVLGAADLAPGASSSRLSSTGNSISEYCCPEPGDHSSYLTWISHLPLLESPQVFGLNSNALVTRDLQDTRQLLDSLLLTQAQEAAGAGAAGARSPEDIVHSSAGDILDKLPADFDLEAAQNKYPVTYLESMNTVLVQELGRANILLAIIRSSLQELRKAVRGLVVMSASLEKVGAALLSGKVPELWLTRSFPSLKPLGPYVREVVERCEFFSEWLASGPPVVFWLSGFFFTQAFLTGAKQNYARKHKVPIDLIDFDFAVKDGPSDCAARPEDGVLIRGLFLESAAWDNQQHCLCESAPKVLFVPVPPMLFLPAKLTEFSKAPTYLCPLYKTSERRGVLSTTGHSTNFVCDIRIPSKHPESHWVMRGCAALTSLDA